MQVNEKRLDFLLASIENLIECPKLENGETINCADYNRGFNPNFICEFCWKKFLTEQLVPAMPDQLFTLRNKPK